MNASTANAPVTQMDWVAVPPMRNLVALEVKYGGLARYLQERLGRPVELTPMEFGLLNTLLSNPGRAFSRMELLERTQGFAYDGYERTVDVHIKNLRKKIEADPGDPQFIITVFGVGYRFNPNP